MDKSDLSLLERIAAKDEEVKALWEEHCFYEKQLEKLENKSFLTPVEEKTIREIKKKKLTGKTKIQAILDRHRQAEE